MTTTIYVTGAAEKEYVGGTITEQFGKDISGATFQIALNTSKTVPPTVWMAPTVSIAGASSASRIVKLLIDATPPGTYYCWVKVTDNPEAKALMVQGNIVVI